MSKLSVEQLEAYAYRLYLLLQEESRANFTSFGKYLDIDKRTARKVYNWAVNVGLILIPSMRLNIFSNYDENVYFLKVRSSTPLFERLKHVRPVIYEAICGGAFDLMVMTTEEIDFLRYREFESVFFNGKRSDFISNMVELKSMESYIGDFDNFLRTGDFTKSTLSFPVRGELKWDDVDWSVFWSLKYDARKKYLDVLKQTGLRSKAMFQQHLNNVLGACTTFTQYYPKRYGNYNEYFFLFKTRHEEQLIEKFKGLPVFCPIFKVKDRVYAYIKVESQYLQLNFFKLLHLMQKSGFIDEYKYSVPILSWYR